MMSYSSIVLDNIKLKNKKYKDEIIDQIESDIRFLIFTNSESIRFNQVLKSVVDRLYGYIDHHKSYYIYEKNIDYVIYDYNKRLDELKKTILSTIEKIKNEQ